MDSALRSLLILLLLLLLTGCAVFAPSPPTNQSDVCAIFEEQPAWYDYAERSRKRWGTPIGTQMAFVQQESSFRSHVRPPRTRLLGFIPWRRPSSAYGYAQAQNPVWGEYREDSASGLLARRTHMKHALDFIGWYNNDTHNRLGISLQNPEHLYLAYHEGRGGYARGSYRAKPQLMRVARRVNDRANRYEAQLRECEDALRCRRFYQFWPFCR
ncbi:MAG: lysozyme-like domain containing protein [Halomonadaceae bacterium]|nr:MAG: lysozyme-like domain containing protein [Halomonadaceae bacterium]